MRTWMVLVAVAFVLAGCASNKKVDQILAQTEAQARRQGQTEELLIALAKRGDPKVAEVLSTVEKGSAVGWTKTDRVLRNPDGIPFLDKNGEPVREVTEAIGKSASGRDITGITKGTLTLAGLPRNNDGTVQITAIPDGFRLEIEAASGTTGPNVEWLQAYLDGIAEEKATIIGGMTALTKERGASFAVKVNAVSKGVCEFLTASGPILGKVLTIFPVSAAAQLASEGVTKIVEATIQKNDGSTTKVLAADTSTGANATAVEKAAAENK